MPEELLTEERIKVIMPLIELDAEAAGTFFINAFAVFPEYRHAGIGRELIALAFDEARKAGMAAVSCRRSKRIAASSTTTAASVLW